MTITGKDFAVSVGINAAVCIVCFAVFNSLRLAGVFRRYYAPKRIMHIEHRKKPPRLPSSYWGWILPLFRMDQTEWLAVAGTDAAMYLRILSFGLELFSTLSVLCLIVVLPTNLTGHEVKNIMNANSTQTQYSDFDYTSLANIEPGSSKMWVHLVMVYVVSYVVLKLLWRYNKECVALRIQYLSTVPMSAEPYTVLVTDVPGLTINLPVQRALDFARKSWIVPKFVTRRLEQAALALTTAGDHSGAALGNIKGKLALTAKLGAYDDEALDELYSVRRTSAGSTEADKARDTLAQVDRSKLGQIDAFSRAERQLARGKSPEALVADEYNFVYGNSVEAVNMVHDQTKLQGMVAGYEKTKQKLEDVVDDYTSKIRRRKEVKRKKTTVVGKMLGEWGSKTYGLKPKKVDLLLHLRDYLQEQYRQIQEAIPGAMQTTMPAAFVTFKNRQTQSVASNSLHHFDQSMWRTQEAPGAEEIIWSNLSWRGWERSLRAALMWGAYLTMIVFFMIPVAFVQSFLQMDKLDKYPPFKQLVSVAFIRGILIGILPSLALRIFLILVPIIITIMNRVQGMISKSAIDIGLAKKYFLFQVVVVFIFQFLAGTLLNQIKQFVKSPTSVISVLGGGVPQQASYFLTYVVLQALSSTPIGLLRISGAVIYYILSKLAGTERAKARIWQNQFMSYGDKVPDNVVVILLGLVFVVIQPIMAPVAFLYFVTASVAWRYQLLYVFREDFQSGGKLWPVVFDEVVWSTFIAQLVMLGYLGIKKFKWTPLLVPLPILTVAYRFIAVSMFARPQSVMSLHTAAQLDRIDKMEEAAGTAPLLDRAVLKNMYLSPVFKIDAAEHSKAIEEATLVDRRLNGEDVPLSADDEPKQVHDDEDNFFDAREAMSEASSLTAGASGASKPRLNDSADNSKRWFGRRQKPVASDAATDLEANVGTTADSNGVGPSSDVAVTDTAK